VGALAGAAVGLVGFLLGEIPATHAMGGVVFLLVPTASGFAIGMGTDGDNRIAAAGLLSTLACLFVLIVTRTETILCTAMVIPLLVFGLIIGVLLSVPIKRVTRRRKSAKTITLLAMPLFVLIGHHIEMRTLIHPRTEAVTNSIWLAATPDKVWANILSFDSLKGRKPLLMYIGLPVPERCEMQGRGVGAKRTCYFDHGSIEETVLEWNPPNRMRLAIDRTNMPGRHWLEFENAEYDLRPENGGTVLTRNTTIISNLYPAWYWRPLERWGVRDEHRYIFEDVARRVTQ